MPMQAQAYTECVIAAGLMVLIVACSAWACDDPVRLLVFLALTLWASALKVRLPRITGTYSANFVFVLIGVAELSLPETLTLAAAGAIAQSLWRPKEKPRMIQLGFNVAALSLSVATSYLLSHFAVAQLLSPRSQDLAVPLVLAAAVSIYFVTNTVLVAVVLALHEEGSFEAVWRNWCLWSFPYYLAGAAIASVISITMRSGGWKSSIVMMPLLYLVYYCWRLHVERQSGAVAR